MSIMHDTHVVYAASYLPGKETKHAMQDKTIVVLGGSSGIGLGVAKLAASQGANVVITSRNGDRLARALHTVGPNGRGELLDASEEGAIQDLFARIGTFDHLAYTAGDPIQFRPLQETNLREARETFEVRYWSALAAVKYASPNIRPGGSIVLTTGITSVRPMQGWAVVSSVCGSMDALTRALSLELAPIRVNAVSPGLVRTDLWKDMPAEQREQFYQSVSQRLPVGRVGDVDDIAKAYLYLMSNGFTTGQILVTDGGTVLV